MAGLTIPRVPRRGRCVVRMRFRVLDLSDCAEVSASVGWSSQGRRVARLDNPISTWRSDALGALPRNAGLVS
jgi:hypothetical protein